MSVLTPLTPEQASLAELVVKTECASPDLPEGK